MMDTTERALLEQAVGQALATESDAERALAALGWLDLLAAAPDDAIAVVGEALGRSHGRAGVLDDVLAVGLGLTPTAELAVVLPRFGTWDPPGANGRARGLVGPRARRARDLAVVTTTPTGLALAVVPGAGATTTPLGGIDPDAGMATIEVDVDTSQALDPHRWDTALALGRRLIAHELAGATRVMLELAREHALTREQFGRPVARFQAVRHRLAETLVAIESLDAALSAAADDRGPVTAALAKALAGRAQQVTARHCQQVLAGIGFTTDHPFHRFLKRTILLDGILGRAEEISLDLGRGLLTRRLVPTLIDL